MANGWGSQGAEGRKGGERDLPLPMCPRASAVFPGWVISSSNGRQNALVEKEDN